jgi:hypothetical protein
MPHLIRKCSTSSAARSARACMLVRIANSAAVICCPALRRDGGAVGVSRAYQHGEYESHKARVNEQLSAIVSVLIEDDLLRMVERVIIVWRGRNQSCVSMCARECTFAALGIRENLIGSVDGHELRSSLRRRILVRMQLDGQLAVRPANVGRFGAALNAEHLVAIVGTAVHAGVDWGCRASRRHASMMSTGGKRCDAKCMRMVRSMKLTTKATMLMVVVAKPRRPGDDSMMIDFDSERERERERLSQEIETHPATPRWRCSTTSTMRRAARSDRGQPCCRRIPHDESDTETACCRECPRCSNRHSQREPHGRPPR